MKTISKKLTAWCCAHYAMSEEDCHIVEYGMESMLNSSVKILIILCVGMLFGHLPEVFTAMFVFGVIRKFAGGYHSHSHLGCLGAMLLIDFCPMLFMHLDGAWVRPFWAILAIYTLYEIIRYAPRNSLVNPIYDERLLLRNRVGSIVTTCAAILFVMVSPSVKWGWIVMLASFAEAVTISPLVFESTKKSE